VKQIHFCRCLGLSVSSDGEKVTSDGKLFHNTITIANSREFNSGNKQIIGGGITESLSKRGVGDGRELSKILRSWSITMQP